MNRPLSSVEQANIAKQRRTSLATATDLYARAHRRVEASPRLSPYSDIILGDWAEGDDHLRWVIRGRVSEIESWAREIQENE